jgi:hypothetical protein
MSSTCALWRRCSGTDETQAQTFLLLYWTSTPPRLANGLVSSSNTLRWATASCQFYCTTGQFAPHKLKAIFHSPSHQRCSLSSMLTAHRQIQNHHMSFHRDHYHHRIHLDLLFHRHKRERHINRYGIPWKAACHVFGMAHSPPYQHTDGSDPEPRIDGNHDIPCSQDSTIPRHHRCTESNRLPCMQNDKRIEQTILQTQRPDAIEYYAVS